jgi:hypothetical protein
MPIALDHGSREIERPRRPRRWAVVGGGIAVLVLLWGLAVRDQPFDAAVWQSVHFGGGPLGSMPPPGEIRRARMLDDLLRSSLQTGMSEFEVTRLLGEPESGDGTDPAGDIATYFLVDRPHWYQALPLLLRWRTTQPVLRIRFGAQGVLRYWVK